MKRKIKQYFLVFLVAFLILSSISLFETGKLEASSYDLTTDVPTTSVTINGAIWEKFSSTDPTGSGVFYAFLRIGKDGFERGYNTDKRPLQFDENSSSQFTHSYLLKDVPMIERGGVIYREFQLDINEQNNSPEWYISLDKFQVWLTNDPNLTGYNEATNSFTSGAIKVYDLDDGSDNWIKMDYRINEGSGKRDYKVLIPQSNFIGKPGQYVVIFARFGDNYSSDDGFEEWGVGQYKATKSGYKFNDLNANGAWDADEPGINGVTINLVGGSTSLSTVTANDANGKPGYYSFTVPAGTYTISEVVPVGAIQTYPASKTYTITLGNGEIDNDNNFGNFYPSPSIDITKTGDALSKAGDEVHYIITITNTGNIALEHISVIDSLLGNISGSFPLTLAVGQSVTRTFTYTVKQTDADPLINNVTVSADPAPLFGIDLTTIVSDSASWSTNLFQPDFTVTKTGNELSKIGDTVHYTITVTNTSSPDTPEMTFHIVDSLLGIDETKVIANGSSYTIEKDFVIPEGASDPFVNTVNVHATIKDFPNTYDKSASWSTDLVHPNTKVTITPNVWETYPGGNVILTITEKNTGDCPINNVKVTLNPGSIELTKTSPYYKSGDTGDDGILGVGEEWVWEYQTTISSDTTFTVAGFGNPVGLANEITPPAYPDEYAEVTVMVTGATRTLGFWQTHLYFTKYVFENYCGSYIDLGWKKIDSIDKLMGIFWANIAKDSTGKKRSNLDQARMVAGQQALAAILNSSMPGGAPLPAGYSPSQIASILAGTNINAIKTLGSVLGTYNESGDGFALDPSLPPTGKATPKEALDVANIPFAD